METITIHCNTNDVLNLTLRERENGLEVVLTDEKNVPVARYEFYPEMLKNVNSIVYNSDNVRIHFVGITPTTKSELVSVKD